MNQQHNSTRTTTILLPCAALALWALTSCGGGGGASMIPGPGGNTGPIPGTADLQGQLVEGSGGRAVSTAGAGLPGVSVSLINAANGALQGSGVTSAMGGFEFKAIPSGDSYLIKVEFTAAQDLDGDGAMDQVKLFFPVSVADQSTTQLLQSISLDDSNSDGSPDAVSVSSDLSDDNGLHESHHSQHRFRDGLTVEDSNGNGSFSDDTGFDDSNCDNLPDSSGDDGTAGSGIELFGVIEAIGAGSFTVAGVEFGFTSATEWQVGDVHHADPSQFPVGTQVKIEGFKASDGSLVATEVKTGQSSSDDHPGASGHVETSGAIEAIGASSVTVDGVEYAFDGATEWKLNGEHASADQFSAGMQVKIEAVAVGAGYRAIEIKSGAGSNSGGSGSGGSGGADDNGGHGSDG